MDVMDKIRPYSGRVVIIQNGEVHVPQELHDKMLRKAQQEGRSPSPQDIFLPSSKGKEVLSSAKT